MWGKPTNLVVSNARARITPTHVGKVPAFYDYIITDNCDLVNAK